MHKPSKESRALKALSEDVLVISRKQLRLLAVGFIVASLLVSFFTYKGLNGVPASVLCTAQLAITPTLTEKIADESKLASKIGGAFGIGSTEAKDIIRAAKAYEDKSFPTHKDILAVIAVESSFQPDAENKGAYGLMQVQLNQHKTNAINVKALKEPLHNIAVGSGILKQYYKMLGKDRDAAIVAYNTGPDPVLKGIYNMEYLDKVKKFRSWLG